MTKGEEEFFKQYASMAKDIEVEAMNGGVALSSSVVSEMRVIIFTGSNNFERKIAVVNADFDPDAISFMLRNLFWLSVKLGVDSQGNLQPVLYFDHNKRK